MNPHNVTKFIHGAFAAAALFFVFSSAVLAQSAARPVFRIGERITFNVAIEHLDNAAFAEMWVVSAGKLGSQDAVELRLRMKTLNLASAALYMVDDAYTTFASPTTGMPLYSRYEDQSSGLPKAVIRDNQAAAAQAYDLPTLIYAIRAAGPGGTFSMQSGDRVYSVATSATPGVSMRTDAGTFETTGVTVQSDFLAERGISEMVVLLSNDEQRIPAGIRFRTLKGEVRATVASIQSIVPGVDASPTPSPVAVQTPRPTPAPTPVPTPLPYVDDQPLSPDLPFVLGENLEYRITMGGQEVGRAVLRVDSRRQFNGADSLLLSAILRDAPVGSAAFRAGDRLQSWVDPITLVPRQFTVNLGSAAGVVDQTAVFDPVTGMISVAGATPFEAPVGTHSVLSLLYAMRSFNLKPSRDNTNPTNDTRVAVFWNGKATVFSLRPGAPELIEIGGAKIQAQPVSITTNNEQLEQFSPKVWLSDGVRRTPLKIALGPYELLLTGETVLPAK